MINWGEKYFDHFEKYLGHVVKKNIFRKDENSPSIQILTYDRVFKGCKVFASIGLSHYAREVKSVVEVVLVVDDGFNECPAILANTLFYMVNEEMEVKSGLSVKGVQRICKEFSNRFEKHALYFTTPFGFPDQFNSVDSLIDGGEAGNIVLACFISEDEAGYLKEFGADKFEDLLISSGVDIFDVNRNSIA